MAVVLRLIRVVALAILLVVVLGLATRFLPPGRQPAPVNYSTLLDAVQAQRVASVVFQGDRLYATLKDQQVLSMVKPLTSDRTLLDTLQQAGVPVQHVPPRQPISRFVPLLLGLLLGPLLLVVFARPAADWRNKEGSG